MKVLVIGGGGREHALVWKIAQSPLVSKVYCAPGNPGIGLIAENVSLAVDDLDGLAAFATEQSIDLTVVGPELPLSLGIVDRFEEKGLLIFGARRNAAIIEASKAFSKDLMKKYQVPTAAYDVFTEVEPAVAFIDRVGVPIVVKADGLAAGKGVIIAHTREEAVGAVMDMLSGNAFGDAGSRVVIEEFLTGEEASFLAFTDGKNIIPLASAQDHKAVFDGDTGPNTGGMGAYSPAPVVTPAIHDKVMAEVMRRTVDGMAAEGRPYRGVLYAGLMINGDQVKTLEFNARFGDPECQPLLMRMKSDIVPVLLAVARGDLSGIELEWHDMAAVCVVMASGGYPADYRKGDEIRGLEDAARMEDLFVFHAGTSRKNGRIVTSGGRVLGVTALGATVGEAIDRAYRGVAAISWDGVHYRKDIGAKALTR
ncbi:phosphoribosylamine--glycine ligase [Geobacter sulfurreducens]|jgi:phosphoribosylamine--glycine ligase|uniref:Phosphoribosylamine--glycine ligase n=1 Tax=Geobacter sulfurreducens (strain ATCC 51573 / DSM 12127 / PCA) TaxID=243231 RepID=Q74FJ8_GEOSL|nr:phosphoribosylamine--glycine ligase [Geobacter sulfurreducens]AAR33941.1 phosphoribosylamine--glycine ligase [Geobacter sulfurreducens PCA]AJY70363.1 phosphoribosylamine--glycine ligase [Geobacter sulfurreducens]QVW35856.1 phosphoribosylamine--glycine ligase [Geobacter sulfurreducens]UAC04680.1 phosphoribosylamine--glycine ligase [Geobacter sulfurreducens]UTG93312.1 phosphoribosylamine--glycine ligase [Geobacter sulfurreducens]